MELRFGYGSTYNSNWNGFNFKVCEIDNSSNSKFNQNFTVNNEYNFCFLLNI